MPAPFRGTVVAAVAAVTVLGAAGYSASDSYEVTALLDSATNVVEGAPVLVNGFDAGRVESIDVRDGKALVRIALDDEHAPLHEGATIGMSWRAVLSERQLVVKDGPEDHAEVPDEGMLKGPMAKPTEIDDILNALDAPTRQKLTGLVDRLEQTLAGREGQAKETVTAAGPALRELGLLLRAVGTDGPAIKDIIRQLDQMVTAVASRDQQVATIVGDLSGLSREVAAERQALRATLKRLPGTLQQATGTLHRVPGAVDAALPLLRDLEPATAELAPVARNLRPVLQDLRPAARDLRPTLARLYDLLGITPGLLDSTTEFLPGLDSTVSRLDKPVEFMRPYTPEITGVISTWNSAFSNYDSNGNYTRLHIQAGPTSFNNNPGIMPPGVVNDPYPAPGAVVGQPWTDANGSGLR